MLGLFFVKKMKDLFQLFFACSGVSTDTRNINKDELFIALSGDNFDGNQYAELAIEKGAKYAIVDNKDFANGNTIHYVENGLKFLQLLAEFHRNKFKIPVIGITGSNGKTTTKELMATVLSKKYNVHYTNGNLNNHIGVPLTLLKLNKEHDIAIIEMGASKVGDIKELTDIAHPTHGIITNIGTAHIEGFGSQENILKTKTELYCAIEEIKGHLFYNFDDSVLGNEIPTTCSTSTYSIEAHSEIVGKLTELSTLLSFRWTSEGYHSPVIDTHLIGQYNLYNMLAAISIGNYFKVDAQLINQGIQEYTPSNNRSQLLNTKQNQLILDAYNANPTSVKAALENFAKIESKDKLFILGDMLELGKDTKIYHQEIIQLSRDLQLQGVFVGNIFSSLKKENDILSFDSVEKVKQFLTTAAPKNNLILLKGSRGIGLEQLIDVL